MKINIKASIFIALSILLLGLFSACSTRPIPGDLILTTYNSDMEETKNFSPMDTLYVKIAGMKPGSFYQISALDADGNLISRIEARTDSEGVIDPTPLWYDLGLKNNDNSNLPPVIESFGALTPVGFKINVKSLYDNGDSTDYTQDVWIIYGKAVTDYNPHPVIYSCYMDTSVITKIAAGTLYPENAFKETGTLDINGNPDDKTAVWVKADIIPSKLPNDVTVTSVDFYVMKFTGESFRDGDKLYDSDKFVLRKTVTVAQAVAGTLLWNLNDPDPALQVINPDQDTMAYSIVMDVDRDGLYDQGVDTNSDGNADYFIDGVDGNGTPGFIIQNTPANDVFITIKDINGNTVNSIPESGANDQQLYINIDNVPAGAADTIGVYLIDSAETGALAFAVPGGYADVRQGGADNGIALSTPVNEIRYLPYLADHKLINTTSAPTATIPAAYTYTGGALAADKHLDLVVDVNDDGIFTPGTDIFMTDAVTILYVPPAPDFTTCSDAAGTTPSQFFDETNTDGGSSIVYLKADNTILPYNVYVFKKKTWADQDYLNGEVESVFNVTGNVTTKIWDLNTGYQVINPTLDNNTYDVVVDIDQDGVYDAGQDEILTVVILDTNANSYPRLTYLNIASGGSFGNTWSQHWTIYSEYCDYRDVFTASGTDTNPNGGGYGVKAVFNPYFSWFCNPTPETPVPGLYYGKYVDVYIVNAKTFDLSDYGHPNELNDDVDVTGRHSTIPVQPSCYNGAGMMTIWRAPMTAGTYYVIVDVNRDGRINQGVDIIDAVNENGKTIIDDPSIVGFSVQ